MTLHTCKAPEVYKKVSITIKSVIKIHVSAVMVDFSLSFPQDMRKHVMMTLLDMEQSYVESLRTLIQVRRHCTSSDISDLIFYLFKPYTL